MLSVRLRLGISAMRMTARHFEDRLCTTGTTGTRETFKGTKIFVTPSGWKAGPHGTRQAWADGNVMCDYDEGHPLCEVKKGIMAINVGQPAPEFSLKDQSQQEVKLSDFRAAKKRVVLVLSAFRLSSGVHQ